MVEQADTGKCHHHIILVAAFDHCIIPDGAARLYNVFHAALMGTLHIVRERKECI